MESLIETKEIFEKTGAKTKLKLNDGNLVNINSIVAEIIGPVRSILIGERLALNFICKMSGIATETKNLVNKCKKISRRLGNRNQREVYLQRCKIDETCIEQNVRLERKIWKCFPENATIGKTKK